MQRTSQRTYSQPHRQPFRRRPVSGLLTAWSSSSVTDGHGRTGVVALSPVGCASPSTMMSASASLPASAAAAPYALRSQSAWTRPCTPSWSLLDAATARLLGAQRIGWSRSKSSSMTPTAGVNGSSSAYNPRRSSDAATWTRSSSSCARRRERRRADAAPVARAGAGAEVRRAPSACEVGQDAPVAYPPAGPARRARGRRSHP
jgi:hypothetical protein